METNTLTTKMTVNDAVKFLSEYPDANVQTCAVVIKSTLDRKARITQLIQESLEQLSLDVKYLAFDLSCTRDERDKAYAKLGGGDAN